jgi:sugar phosphate permease
MKNPIQTDAGGPPGMLERNTVDDDALNALYTRITWRLVPFLFLCYIASFIDRINVSFAQLQMKTSLGFSPAIYGTGAGLFFVTYLMFELPSNLFMARMGIRRTLFRIMALWGVVSICTAFVRTPMEFYIARLLLGAAEAGFFPAVMLYLTYWFPPARLGRVTTRFMSALVVSGLIAGPTSGWILQNMQAVGGLNAWQWIFILEGIPSVLLALLAFFVLADRPEHASWLAPHERERIAAELSRSEASHGASVQALAQALRNPRIYLWGIADSCVICALYGISFWLPQILSESAKLNYRETGLYSAVPYLFALVYILWIGNHAERHNEYRWHFACSALMGAFGLTCSVIASHNLFLSLLGLSLANAGLLAALPLFWPTILDRLPRNDAPGGIALITSIGVASGLLSPMLVGWVKTFTGQTRYGMYPMIFLGVAAAVVYLLSTGTARTAATATTPTRS